MNILSVINNEKQVSEKDLEVLLIDFLKYGEPSLWKMDKGWYCKVEMRVMSLGTTFQVKSDHDNKTPLNAVIQCRKRMLDALDNLK